MKKYLIAISCLSISAYAIAKERPSIESNFPVCGQSILNGKTINKVCATRDFIAPEPRKRKRDWLAFLAAEGSSGYKGPRDPVGGIFHFENKELDMQGHVWDFSKQENPSLVLEGHDSTIKNGIILNANITLGQSNYCSPNFSTKTQCYNIVERNGFIYAKTDTSGKIVERMKLENFKNKGGRFGLYSWDGMISNSRLLLNSSLDISGSKANILTNNIISKAIFIEEDRKQFILSKINKTIFVDQSSQILPDRWHDNVAIPSTLYLKFSPDTVIDGNTFTLTNKNDQAYAIVLDHSPRVRITNNIFNGFKVPILMDQWSSIVDEKGNEIKPQQFTGNGNVINPNKYAGEVTMNRKGEIVKK